MTTSETIFFGENILWISTLLWIIGGALYTKARGYRAILGAFGFFNILGFIVVAAIVSHFEYHKKVNLKNNQ